MRLIQMFAFVTAALVLSGCVIPGSDIAWLLDNEFPRDNPEPSSFIVCIDHGCTTEVDVSLSDAEWARVRDIFARPPAMGDQGTALGERTQIAFALAELEQLVVPQVGSGNERGGSFANIGMRDQMDCVDEMVNTATYLTMMNNDGLLQHHRPGRRMTEALGARGLWPHTVATVYALEEQRHYVIDTWIKDNGEVPYVMALNEWSSGANHRDLITGVELTADSY